MVVHQIILKHNLSESENIKMWTQVHNENLINTAMIAYSETKLNNKHFQLTTTTESTSVYK